jgi:hypothetical protein
MTSERRWRKASASNSNSQCVEVAADGRAILVRDSKDPDGPRLSFSKGELAAFVDGIKRGEFDDLID